MLPPRGLCPFSGSQARRWSKAAAITLRRCSPHPPRHQHILPVGAGVIGTRLQTHLPVTPCCSHHSPFRHMEGLRLCPAVAQHRVALPLVWTPKQFPWKIRHCPSADHPSIGTDPCRAAEHFTWALPFGSILSLATDHNVQYPAVHRLMAKERASPTAALGKRNEHFSPSV